MRSSSRVDWVKVLVAHSAYRLPGGEDSYVNRQVELLRSRHDVQVFMPANEELKDSPSTALRMFYSGHGRRDIAARLDRFRPDVVHMHNAYPSLGPSVPFAAKDVGVPVVMTVHNMRLRCPNAYMFTEGSICRRCEDGNYANAVVHRCFPSRKQAAAYASVLWAHRFIFRLEQLISRFIVPSPFMRARLVEWGLDPARISVVRHFTRPAATAGEPGTEGLFVGRMSAEKGVDVLLNALAKAGDPPFCFVGGGPLLPVLKELASSLGLTNSRFVGHVESDLVRRAISQSRFVVVPSIWEEAFGLVAIEAMGGGRPVLVSEVGALADLVAQGRGLTFRTGDAEDAAAKIRTLLEDDDLCKTLARAGRGFVQSELTPERHLRGLEAAYLSTATNGPHDSLASDC